VKVILFANTDWFLYNFRLRLAIALRQRGAEVVLLSPPGDYSTRLEQAGFRWLPFRMARRGMNPLAELGTILRLARLYRRERPELVHHFTIKCVLYGSLAGRWTGVPAVVNAITGLGYVFTEGGRTAGSWPKRLLRTLVSFWYRLALRGTQVIFENQDNLAEFVRQGLVRPEAAHLVRGAGVDVTAFRPSSEPAGGPVVMLAARMLWDKGVGEFVEAARRLRAEGVQASFVLVGDTYADNPAAIPIEQLRAWQQEGAVAWWGWHDDMPAMIEKAHVICLPSYLEGLPTVLLEAAACGRPVVTTDVPGCRDAVLPNVSGLLVPVRDVGALADAIRRLIQAPDLRRKMGRAGREMVERDFSTEHVIAGTVGVYQRAGMEGLSS
jgi:glycosyltransferase involved in cell wall biosynthesis